MSIESRVQVLEELCFGVDLSAEDLSLVGRIDNAERRLSELEDARRRRRALLKRVDALEEDELRQLVGLADELSRRLGLKR
jgi:hypothetical protein